MSDDGLDAARGVFVWGPLFGIGSWIIVIAVVKGILYCIYGG